MRLSADSSRDVAATAPLLAHAAGFCNTMRLFSSLGWPPRKERATHKRACCSALLGPTTFFNGHASRSASIETPFGGDGIHDDRCDVRLISSPYCIPPSFSFPRHGDSMLWQACCLPLRYRPTHRESILTSDQKLGTPILSREGVLHSIKAEVAVVVNEMQRCPRSSRPLSSPPMKGRTKPSCNKPLSFLVTRDDSPAPATTRDLLSYLLSTYDELRSGDGVAPMHARIPCTKDNNLENPRQRFLDSSILVISGIYVF